MKRTIQLALLGFVGATVPQGVSLAKAGDHGDHKKEAEEGDEETITIDQAPAAVRTTIENESRGAQIKKIEREKKAGKYVYELEILKGGQQLEIKIAEDGSVLKRKAEKPGED